MLTLSVRMPPFSPRIPRTMRPLCPCSTGDPSDEPTDVRTAAARAALGGEGRHRWTSRHCPPDHGLNEGLEAGRARVKGRWKGPSKRKE
eukprot:scaffold676_cov316-Pavlova_lutheri.AAC.42